MQTNSPSVLKEHHCLPLSSVPSISPPAAKVFCSLMHSVTVLNNKACTEKQARC